MIGQTVDDYRILSEIGAGGMGVVYLAHDEVLQREVAPKLLRSEIANEPGSRTRIRREARAALRGVPQYFTFFKTAGSFVIP